MLFACRIIRLNAPFSSLAARSRVQPTVTRQQQIGVRRLLLCPPPHSRGFSISQRLNIDQASAAPSLSGAPKTPFLRRALAVTAIGIFFTSAGFVMATIPAFTTANELLHPPSDEETLRMYIPGDDFARDVDDYIRNHPLAVELRSKPEYSESRPHLKVPPSARSHSLTSGTLMGPGKVIVPPYAWSERGGKSLVTISYLGTDLCGHAGIVHGGLLATILDESLARCCFAALPNKIGMTANLNINYRAPVPAGSYIVLRAKTTKVEGRKAWVEGRLESLVADGETPIIYADASALFIEPRQAASMAKIYPVQ